MKLVIDSNNVLSSILEYIKMRAQVEAKHGRSATTQRAEASHARGFRVLSDLAEDLSKATFTNESKDC